MVTQVMMIPYLVLVAIEAVALATRYWDGNGAGSLTRLSNCVLPAATALVSCVGSGVWLAHDLRAAPRVAGTRPHLTFWLLLARVVAAIAPPMCAGYLVTRTIPMINTQLNEGIHMAIDLPIVVIVLIGFAGLSGGIAARAATVRREPGTNDPEVPNQIMDRIAAGGILGSLTRLFLKLVACWIIFAVVVSLLPVEKVGWLPWQFYELAGKSMWLLRKILEGSLYNAAFLFAGFAWLFIVVIGEIVVRGPQDEVPFDRLLENGDTLGRFMRSWLSLTALLASSLPALFVAGLVGYHFFLKLLM
jgi:hypothetical protein